MSKPAERPEENTLVRELLGKAQERKHSPQQLADALRVSPSYLYQLKTGSRPESGVNDDFISHASRYLGIPRIYALIMAGKIRRSDFYGLDDGEHHSAVEQALFMVAGSKHARQERVSMEMLGTLPFPVQSLIVALFEEATGCVLIPRKPSRPLEEWAEASNIGDPLGGGYLSNE